MDLHKLIWIIYMDLYGLYARFQSVVPHDVVPREEENFGLDRGTNVIHTSENAGNRPQLLNSHGASPPSWATSTRPTALAASWTSNGQHQQCPSSDGWSLCARPVLAMPFEVPASCRPSLVSMPWHLRLKRFLGVRQRRGSLRSLMGKSERNPWFFHQNQILS